MIVITINQVLLFWTCGLSAAHCRQSFTQPASKQWVQLHTYRTPELCQPSFGLSAQRQFDSCTWSFWSTWQSVGFGCSWSAELHFVSSAVFCHLSSNLSALAYSVMQFICCDRPAARHQLSYELQAPLQSVILAAICLLSHDMSTWQQSFSSVCQLSCDTLAQLRYVSSAAIWRLISIAVWRSVRILRRLIN